MRVLDLKLFGESHGEMIGGVLSAFPAGHKPDFIAICADMKRRAPGSTLGSGRAESDDVKIISGVKSENISHIGEKMITTGAPLAFIINNEDADSDDYEKIKNMYRPGHADYTADIRYSGYNDQNGGGHLSGRLTAPFTFAGLLCKDFLKQNYGIKISSEIMDVGGVKDISEVKNLLKDLKDKGDSVGGRIKITAENIPAGLGSPWFDNVESRLSYLLFSIPGIKGIEFGTGFEFAEMYGSEAKDEYEISDNNIQTKTNHNGGVLGGITNGMPMILSIVFKPTPSISLIQKTVNHKKNSEADLCIPGRHDPCIAWRGGVITEGAVALGILDMLLERDGFDKPAANKSDL